MSISHFSRACLDMIVHVLTVVLESLLVSCLLSLVHNMALELQRCERHEKKYFSLVKFYSWCQFFQQSKWLDAG